MPLVRGNTRAAISQNIRTERAAGVPQRQAVGIALNTARRSGNVKPPNGMSAPSLGRMLSPNVANLLAMRAPFKMKKARKSLLSL